MRDAAKEWRIRGEQDRRGIDCSLKHEIEQLAQYSTWIYKDSLGRFQLPASVYYIPGLTFDIDILSCMSMLTVIDRSGIL